MHLYPNVQRDLCTVRPILMDVQSPIPCSLHGQAYTLHGRLTQEAKLLLYWVPKGEITYLTLQMDKNVRKSNVFGTFYKGFGVWVGFKELWKPGCHNRSDHSKEVGPFLSHFFNAWMVI